MKPSLLDLSEDKELLSIVNDMSEIRKENLKSLKNI